MNIDQVTSNCYISMAPALQCRIQRVLTIGYGLDATLQCEDYIHLFVLLNNQPFTLIFPGIKLKLY